MPTVYVDGQPIELDSAHNLLAALLAKGVNLPYFCWHPALGSVGACRQCAVVQFRDENDTRGRIVMSCMTPVTEGARFSVDDATAREFRTSVIENLMINHPHDCPVCEEGGECHLQDMTVMTGHRDRKYRGTKTTFRNQYLGPLVGHEMNRCITCYRCVRFYQDYAGGHDLAAFASRDHVYFGRAEDGVLSNEFAGNLVEVCPTGVFTDKPLSTRYTRKWDLQSAPSVCVGCSLGCNTIVSERYGELRRIHNRYNARINGYFLCDRGRYGGAFVNSPDRIPYTGIRRKGEGTGDGVDGGEGGESVVFEAAPADEGLAHVAALLQKASSIVGIGSPRASIESNFMLRKLVGEQNFYAGVSDRTGAINQLALEILETTRATPVTLQEVEAHDAILILGEDTTNHAPRLALSLRQAVRARSQELASGAQIPAWHDAAVRKIGQKDFSPLVVVTPYQDRLDDVAQVSIRETPDNIASLGFSIAASLSNESSAESPGDLQADKASGKVGEICRMLKSAQRPLIVTGASPGNAGILKAAANIANNLARVNENTGLVVCLDECNSLGMAILDENAKGLDSLATGDRIDVALVLENDLATRLPTAAFRQLLARIDNLVVLDHADSETASAANVVLPAATFAEAEGTFVNNQGMAQRAFAVFPPAHDIAPSWRWLARLGQAIGSAAFDGINEVDDVIAQCEAEIEGLAGIVSAAPNKDFRIHGARIPRMTHRYSGRTAMLADINIHEPQQPVDSGSPLAFTMEGAKGNVPAALRPFTWSPGWNSNQAINKFQAEPGGALTGGDTAVSIIRRRQTGKLFEPAAPSRVEADELPLVARHHIFGSEELSVRAPAIAELVPRSYCMIHPDVATALSVESGDGLSWEADGEVHALEVIVDRGVAPGCVVYAYGFGNSFVNTRPLLNSTAKVFRRAENWTRRPSRTPNVITSDKDR